ncbi:MAG: hypothetical protein GY913_24250 [Proteobacteria bacterium]|nr:hypothetical protein [Pseudomonadota bacterium]MCP4920027.1 hypothetical protein [Pseudomonadota bacterium]
MKLPLAFEKCDGLDNDCDGIVPSNEQDLTGDGNLDCEELSCSGDGMTWAQSTLDEDLGTVGVSCSAGEYDCDA